MRRLASTQGGGAFSTILTVQLSASPHLSLVATGVWKREFAIAAVSSDPFITQISEMIAWPEVPLALCTSAFRLLI